MLGLFNSLHKPWEVNGIILIIQKEQIEYLENNLPNVTPLVHDGMSLNSSLTLNHMLSDALMSS